MCVNGCVHMNSKSLTVIESSDSKSQMVTPMSPNQCKYPFIHIHKKICTLANTHLNTATSTNPHPFTSTHMHTSTCTHPHPHSHIHTLKRFLFSGSMSVYSHEGIAFYGFNYATCVDKCNTHKPIYSEYDMNLLTGAQVCDVNVNHRDIFPLFVSEISFNILFTPFKEINAEAILNLFASFTISSKLVDSTHAHISIYSHISTTDLTSKYPYPLLYPNIDQYSQHSQNLPELTRPMLPIWLLLRPERI